MGLYEDIRHIHDKAHGFKEAAGRSGAGRMLAVLCTDLEKSMAWVERLHRLHGDEQEYMVFGDGVSGRFMGEKFDVDPTGPAEGGAE